MRRWSAAWTLSSRARSTWPGLLWFACDCSGSPTTTTSCSSWSIITATPGTTWVRYDRAAGVVTIHVLDLVDEQAWIRLFKQRYERHLLEIFE